MSEAPTLVASHRRHLGWLQRGAVLASWILACVLFVMVGQFALAPDDPRQAVSLLTRQAAVSMFVQAAALAAVVSALATMVAGRSLPDVGAFAVSIGLAFFSTQGGTAAQLWLPVGQSVGPSARVLALEMAFEALAWFVVVWAGFAAGAAVWRWLCLGRRTEPGLSGEDGHAPSSFAAIELTSLLRHAKGQETGLPALVPANGVAHMIATAAVALAVMMVLSAGVQGRLVQHGQSCFNVAFAVCVGAYFAHRKFPVPSAFWSVLAVPVAAVLGLAFAGIAAGGKALDGPIPPSGFFRVLPIQYICVGVAAAIGMFWHMEADRPDPAPVPPSRSGRPTRERKR